MSDEEIFNQQHNWLVFFNKPISKSSVKNILHGLSDVDIGFGDAGEFHSVVFKDLAEINKLRAILLVENYKMVFTRTSGERVYLDVYNE